RWAIPAVDPLGKWCIHSEAHHHRALTACNASKKPICVGASSFSQICSEASRWAIVLSGDRRHLTLANQPLEL
ncbi:MAG: hypothetical protein ACK4L7_04045, partial [Flavobacteriales bacterium]